MCIYGGMGVGLCIFMVNSLLPLFLCDFCPALCSARSSHLCVIPAGSPAAAASLSHPAALLEGEAEERRSFSRAGSHGVLGGLAEQGHGGHRRRGMRRQFVHRTGAVPIVWAFVAVFLPSFVCKALWLYCTGSCLTVGTNRHFLCI